MPTCLSKAPRTTQTSSPTYLTAPSQQHSTSQHGATPISPPAPQSPYSQSSQNPPTRLSTRLRRRSQLARRQRGQCVHRYRRTFPRASQSSLNQQIQILTLPPIHRTFVTSSAIGLLLMYVLDGQPEGLGLRRCVWQCDAANEVSKRTASRMGFRFEGVQRFHRLVPKGKVGMGLRWRGRWASQGIRPFLRIIVIGGPTRGGGFWALWNGGE
jgi:hypothetical protein